MIYLQSEISQLKTFFRFTIVSQHLCLSPSYCPPLKLFHTYREEDQAEWATRSWLRSCECVHFPLKKVTHEYELVTLGDPPQAISPDWVWKYLSFGRSGKLHQLIPSFESNSTDLCPLKSAPYPPETIIAEKISLGCFSLYLYFWN